MSPEADSWLVGEELTNGFSKKVENHAHAVSLHFAHYNLSRPHQTLSGKVNPAMAAGIESHPWLIANCANCWNEPGERHSVSPGRG